MAAVICQKGYLIIPGVLYPTPNSRKTTRSSLRLRKNHSYRWAARYQPSSWTKVLSARRFMDMGAPHTGQRGTSSVGTARLGRAGGSSPRSVTWKP